MSDKNLYYFLKGLDELSTEKDFIFVILPFENSLIFETIIKPTAKEIGLRCSKADDMFSSGAIMEKIAQNIQKSSLIIADLSNKNPNVFYELGLAHALKKNVIMITQSSDDVPSDLRSLEYFKYSISNSQNIFDFKSKLKNILESVCYPSKPDIFYEKIWDINSNKGNEELIEADFLKRNSGTICFWLNVNQPMIDSISNIYFISHCSNDGKKSEIEFDNDYEDDNQRVEPLSRYCNVFAIRKVRNSEKYPTGNWGFWCSDKVGNYTHIIHRDRVDIGWHLFTVIWSKGKNYIKYFLDKGCVGTSSFTSWPEEINDHFFIGTWPSRSKGSYVNTNIGKVKIFESPLDFDEIWNIYNEEPELKA